MPLDESQRFAAPGDISTPAGHHPKNTPKPRQKPASTPTNEKTRAK
jgi:hypothetical protein